VFLSLFDEKPRGLPAFAHRAAVMPTPVNRANPNRSRRSKTCSKPPRVGLNFPVAQPGACPGAGVCSTSIPAGRLSASQDHGHPKDRGEISSSSRRISRFATSGNRPHG